MENNREMGRNEWEHTTYDTDASSGFGDQRQHPVEKASQKVEKVL